MLYYPGPEPRIQNSAMTTSEVAKFNMIAQQIRPWEVLDPRVLAVLDEIDDEKAWDVIAVTGSLAALPDNLQRALKPGGRLFVVVGSSPVMEAMLITRVGESEWTRQSLFETDLPRVHG